MTSGLVVTLDPDSPAAALDAIRAASVFAVGERIESHLPVALETEDAAAGEWWTDWLRQLPGVVGVEVVFVHWDDAEDTHAGD